MSIPHAAVWLDREEARIFHIDRATFQRTGVRVKHHLHPPNKTGADAELHRTAAEQHPFFDDIAGHLSDVQEVLVVGPADATLEFVTYVKSHHHDLARKLVGVEACDHPSDGKLVAEVRKYFLTLDRIRA